MLNNGCDGLIQIELKLAVSLHLFHVCSTDLRYVLMQWICRLKGEHGTTGAAVGQTQALQNFVRAVGHTDIRGSNSAGN